jgi:hypothetical protein
MKALLPVCMFTAVVITDTYLPEECIPRTWLMFSPHSASMVNEMDEFLDHN